MYLSGNIRPDIAYAVNCCARYMTYRMHARKDAINRIGPYLKATSEIGLIFNPKLAKNGMAKVLQLYSYPDVD